MIKMKKFIIILIILCNCCGEDNRFYAISKDIVNSERDYYIFDPLAGHIHKSNAWREYAWPEHKDGKIILKTNNLGFRSDVDTNIDKQGRIRILVTGDSHIDGVINNSESCCTILQNMLNQAADGQLYEVINSGTGYYFSRNYLGLIQKYLYLAPDVYIVILYGGNEFLKTCSLIGCRKSDNPGYYAKLREVRSFNPGGVAQGLNQIYYFKNVPESMEICVKSATDDIYAIKQICELHNITLIVLLLPSKIEIEWSTDELSLNKSKELLELTDADLQKNLKILDKIASLLNNQQISYLNLFDYMKGKDHKLFWNKDYHLNDYGHKVIAETLFATYKDKIFQRGEARVAKGNNE
jgi:lysophospholipase L1-like esterase